MTHDRPQEPLELRCQPSRPCEHVIALTAAGQQAMHVTNCPEQGKALLDHACRLAAAHGYDPVTTHSTNGGVSV